MKLRVELTSAELDEAEARNFASASGHGAVVVFLGVVRDIHEGRAVSAVDYTAYEPLARAELERVAREAAGAHEVGAIALFHRIGRLPVGSVSLVVAVGSRHRRPAFECALLLVDLLKQRVPIWKQEFGPDGSHWVEGTLPPAAR
ncbi:MAG: molybdenum cofactor biosynthesis protein MoaE [Planctomycetes bacterium]|nr:molybdenum cofactor biosynthesis protein MoaE [Planctomycetota bacterium]